MRDINKHPMPNYTRPSLSRTINLLGFKSSQSGMALLTILLLVVAITVVAASMIASQGIMMRQYHLLLTQDQLIQDIKAGEQIAVALIQTEAQINDTDSLQDAWAKPLPPYQLGQHQLILTIKDESSRFNLNNLYHDGKLDEAALGVLQRLLTQLGLDESLAYTIADWQDPDNALSIGEGQENELYAGQGVTIANQPFVSVDALSDVSGFDADMMAVLKPYITAVPYYLPVNVNTADVVLLSALTSNNGEEGSNAQYDMPIMKDESERQIFESVGAYIETLPQLTPETNDSELTEEQKKEATDKAEKDREALAQLLSVDSQAFGVLIDVIVEDKHRYATGFISKVKASQENNEDNKVTDDANKGEEGTDLNQNTQASAEQSDEPRIIQAFGSRLWTYRPSF